ncbi:toxin-antitoxin system, antitoxin component [Canicola haemoglobinophilus]|uniref:Uncharacterized protein conserved in bacteria n=1 Tax=Canicola haemoglobinophilus TaxID=733 RepID=A0A1V4AZI7_9PAST|nr:BrnA antitoxin family protein [Canicola haemoglobinophilus]MBN6710475.1 BrnA antitoxin family protein [Canicola haemoglobinophilus]OOR98563.1 toxin-antitoxin system, antitoxin component [Canicola haemoglobinophilus]STO55139.1 Uncharacterized protein conserved in bacteria [Canicola haemoglobinophilus]STO59626.1 Uncharacterized protein conserved in bacteria [Canicola haemoglobinophilus]STO69290.1 Uncharacterized protein conserved in bacteria [Canicola haemoglobinophilus]
MKVGIYDDPFENTEYTEEELDQFRPIQDVMPAEFLTMVKRHRGKQKAPTKQAITIRLSPEVVNAFKATGKGWQSRINEILLKHVNSM